MLIVSQDKMKSTERMELWIEELWENTEFEKKLFYIKSPIGTLGTYETKGRAKEVLQAIVKEYSRVLKTQSRETGQISFYNVPKVYYMPEQ